MIFEDLRPHIYRDITKMVKRSFEALKLMAYSPQLKPQTDRIHVANGTLMLTNAPDSYGELKPESNVTALLRATQVGDFQMPIPFQWASKTRFWDKNTCCLSTKGRFHAIMPARNSKGRDLSWANRPKNVKLVLVCWPMCEPIYEHHAK